MSSHVIRFSQAYCKFNEVLGGKEQDTSWNVPGKTVVINVVFIAHKMFHEKSTYKEVEFDRPGERSPE